MFWDIWAVVGPGGGGPLDGPADAIERSADPLEVPADPLEVSVWPTSSSPIFSALRENAIQQKYQLLMLLPFNIEFWTQLF